MDGKGDGRAEGACLVGDGINHPPACAGQSSWLVPEAE
jgi:hypothetical protein